MLLSQCPAETQITVTTATTVNRDLCSGIGSYIKLYIPVIWTKPSQTLYRAITADGLISGIDDTCYDVSLLASPIEKHLGRDQMHRRFAVPFALINVPSVFGYHRPRLPQHIRKMRGSASCSIAQ